MKAKSISLVAVLAAASALMCSGSALADHRVVELVSTGSAGGNGAFDVSNFHISRDGTHSFFTTSERLVAADTDSHLDLYQRVGGTTTLLSTGPAGGNGPFDVQAFGSNLFSADGSRVLFLTRDRLTADDADDQLDLYLSANGTPIRVSTGPAGGNGPFGVGYVALSENGQTIAFTTSEALTADDTNSESDLYVRTGDQVKLVSGGPVNPNFDFVFPIGISSDGSRVFFSSTRQLAPGDDDLSDDVYKWEAGARTLESVSTAGQNSASPVFGEHVDAAGTHLFFMTYGRLAPEDVDDSADLYDRSGGVTRLASIGPTGGNGAFLVSGEGASRDGSHVFFTTFERLVPADTDDYQDLYMRADGVTTLVSTGPLAGNEDFVITRYAGSSDDGRHVLFTTRDRLTAEDTDGGVSAYEYSEGAVRWLAPAYQGAGTSADGSRLFIFTNASLVPEDIDGGCPIEGSGGCNDLYEIQGDRVTLISTGPTDPGGATSACRLFVDIRSSFVCPASISADGARVLFWSNAQLVSSDTDASYDVYLASTAAGPPRDDRRAAAHACRAERRDVGSKAFKQRYGKPALRNCIAARV